MYLSKLEMVGFKSFAQKVSLAFDSGISAIVGPNGCGKTNIVDAIRWVLGEQRYSALRSEKMEDVIFNGTKARKAVGMAEASLVIENTKGILPSEYTQVTIGRRVYRSGESEYLLNKVSCRLKDILDLFMDTGMGADAYSVIELKMIETILSDKTDERRRLFEEAAGVTKYKHRRKAAYRKLESVQADLVRVNDIVAEVQKAVNSLERQAKKAEQFNEVKEKLRALEIDLMEREFAQYHARMEPLKEKLAALQEDKSKIDVDLSQGEGELETLRGRMVEVEKRLAEAQRDVALHMEKVHRVEEKNLVAAERTRSLQTNIQRHDAEIAELGLQKIQQEQLITALGQRMGLLQGQEEQTKQELDLKQEELHSCEMNLEEKKSELQALNGKTIALVHEIAGKQTEQDRKRGRMENLRGRMAHADEETAAYNMELVRLEEDIAARSAEDRQLRRKFTEAEMKYYDVESKKKDLREKAEGLRGREVDLENEIHRYSGRVDFLKGLIESREGLSEGVRYLSTSDRWKPARNVTVADVVHAEDRLRTAIEAALGENAGLIVVDAPEDAERGIELLKEDQRGKATFVCLNRMPRIVSKIRLPALSGLLGWASELALYDAEYEHLFRFILDGILVVDNAETAKAVVGAVPGARCVTLEGEMLTGVGVLRGGSKRHDEGGTIGKQKQIDDLLTEIQAKSGVLGEVGTARQELMQEHDTLDLKSLSDGVKAIEKEMNGVEMRIAQLEFEKKRASDIIARNNEEKGTLAGEAAALEGEILMEEPALQALSERKGEVERTVGALSTEIQTLEEEWNERSRVVNDLGITFVTVRGELQNAANELKRAEGAIADIGQSLEKNHAGIGQARGEISEADALVADNVHALVELQAELSGLDSRRTAVEDESSRIREEIHRIELAIKDQRRTHDDSLRSAHESELKLADLAAKSAHITARSLEEFECTIVLKSYPDDEFVDFAALREEIQTLRDRTKTLGNINFAAFEEYQAEKERFEFLSTQRQDLHEAEKTLLATIEEINATAQKKFTETFAQIRTNFIETFKSLFDPGDECDLRLEEDVDPLEAKIEIVAKPRGKRPTSIDLLSGGEKTLTAIALLFAIYLVKPSPFCILDEVDAPLDDANVDRFTRILHKFSNNTQFIVVTHNKRTMEAASALYGVTMEEEGVSKLVTVRFNQSAQVEAAIVASA